MKVEVKLATQKKLSLESPALLGLKEKQKLHVDMG